MSLKYMLLTSACALTIQACENDERSVVVTPPTNVTFARTDLVTNADDPNLVNPWGLIATNNGFWMADNVTGKVSIYDGTGQPVGGAFPSGSIAPGTGITGVTQLGGDIVFARQDGKLVAFSDKLGTVRLVIDGGSNASYTGVTSARGELYVANFANGTVDTFDSNYRPLTALGGFIDTGLPQGYAPFNVMAIGESIYVAYALVDSSGDETHGPGLGIVDRFDLDGKLSARIATDDVLNAPWGMALAPASFGDLAGMLLVGNFGDGRITAYDTLGGGPGGQLAEANGTPIVIDGLWGITFGNDARSGNSDVLYFTAGPANETAGLFGRIEPSDVTLQ